MHRAQMLNVHRARLLAAGPRAATPPSDDESRILCAVVASVTSLMLLCGLVSVVPGPKAYGVAKTYLVAGLGAGMLLLMLAGWLLAPWFRTVADAQMCACGLGDAAALGALPTFAYEPPEQHRPSRAASEVGGGEAARGSCALCAVCLEDVRAGEMVRRLPACGHLFHVSCVDVWLRSHRTCPICRCELPPCGAVVGTKQATAAAVVPTQMQAPDALPPV